MQFRWNKIYETESPVSGNITVLENGQQRKLIIGSATQSRSHPGPRRSVWSTLMPDSEIGSVLILGLGAGTEAKLLRERWPEVRIVGYELDPAVVRVATSFFDLDKRVEVHVADARKAFTSKEKFDLVIVDIYCGLSYPEFAKSEDFIKNVKKMLQPDGLASFNRVTLPEHRHDVQAFEGKIKTIFPKVWKKKVGYNTIFWGQVSS